MLGQIPTGGSRETVVGQSVSNVSIKDLEAEATAPLLTWDFLTARQMLPLGDADEGSDKVKMFISNILQATGVQKLRKKIFSQSARAPNKIDHTHAHGDHVLHDTPQG